MPAIFLSNRVFRQVLHIAFVLFLSHGTQAAEPLKKKLKAQCQPVSFTIVIDVGHTREASGALSARGVSEFSYNLNLGKAVEDTLVGAGFADTQLMVSSGTGQAQLLARTARANGMTPDLLLSLHHDSVQSRYLSQWNVNGKTNSYSDAFAGFSLFVASDTAFSKESLEFARLLSDALTDRGLRYSLHHAEKIPGEGRILLDAGRGIYGFNELVVLRHTRAPAVLLEAGVIVNRAEETVLQSPEFRQKIAGSVLEAVRSFCAARQSRQWDATAPR